MRILKQAAPWTGWILLGLLAWQFRGRVLFKVDSLFLKHSQAVEWEQIIQAKKASLEQVRWQDSRPLILMLGDSQVEMGPWYELFRGRFAIRNAGLSQAKTADVACLARATAAIHPEMVVLMCGINDLGAGRSVDDALKDYFQLLGQIGADLSPNRIVALSVMPVASRRIADGSRDLNARVRELNARIHDQCLKLGVAFLDVTPAVAEDGALRDALTWDGLHLNPPGYQKLARWMEPLLLETYGKIPGH